MTTPCRHAWLTIYAHNTTYNAYLPSHHECTKCGKRQWVSQEMFDKLVADLKAREKVK